MAAIHTAPRRSVSESAHVSQLKSQIEFQRGVIQSLSVADGIWKDVVKEWTATHGAFKRLAWEYGRRLGIDEADWTRRFRQHIVDLAAEDPDLAATSAATNAAAAIAELAAPAATR